MPSWDSFDAQLRACRDEVLPPEVLARLAVEPGAVQGGHRWVGNGGDVPGMEGFGAPALAGALLREFGFTVHDVVLRARRLLAATRRGAKKRLMAWVFWLEKLTMTYTFKCKTAGDVTMAQADGGLLLQIIGKSPVAEGIIEVAAMNAAIQALENAAARELANLQQAGQQDSTEPDDRPAGGDPIERVERVELHQRIFPLVKMLKRARDDGEVIVWGV